ncbi:trafficking protein mon1 subfamily protein [Toxoplasma gondii ME49]|uniref:Trafficking protein mon1 subfamily protein n=4 Tax=Toxoplasma gondii TaxID=5811 RepID=A0A2G8Y2N2_TOXGO|nr:trafficking protein mon1 subfamily protein [Toxoplasma gondii ME49]EPT28071.1 trafficking protein mon1 subfamily protein [Toxoplasma gondii ME49]PIM01517.1 trafficking protein mon1 subfamily protein [Toxoplasma gondii COUG]|eukprot:XP_018636461.1 trafficking protein mon1 subfamily protein [Toxoplasma gondii ME49]
MPSGLQRAADGAPSLDPSVKHSQDSSVNPVNVWSLFDEAAIVEGETEVCCEEGKPSGGPVCREASSPGSPNFFSSSEPALRLDRPSPALHPRPDAREESQSDEEFFDAPADRQALLEEDLPPATAVYASSPGAEVLETQAALEPPIPDERASVAWTPEALELLGSSSPLSNGFNAAGGRPGCDRGTLGRVGEEPVGTTASAAPERAAEDSRCWSGAFYSMEGDGISRQGTKSLEGFSTPILQSSDAFDADDCLAPLQETGEAHPQENLVADAASSILSGSGSALPRPLAADPRDRADVYLTSPGGRERSPGPEKDLGEGGEWEHKDRIFPPLSASGPLLHQPELSPASCLRSTDVYLSPSVHHVNGLPEGGASSREESFDAELPPGVATLTSGAGRNCSLPGNAEHPPQSDSSASSAPLALPLLPPSRLLNLPDSAVAHAAKAAGVSVASVSSAEGSTYVTATTADVVVVHNKVGKSPAEKKRAAGGSVEVEEGVLSRGPQAREGRGRESEAEAGERKREFATETDLVGGGTADGESDGDSRMRRKNEDQPSAHGAFSARGEETAELEEEDKGEESPRSSFRKVEKSDATDTGMVAMRVQPGAFTSQNSLAKKKMHQDDSDPAWYMHKRHVFIFTFSGKPVYSRYGNEERLSAFTGALSAIVSKMESFFFFQKKNDCLRCMNAGDRRFVFLRRGPLYLVSIDSTSGNVQQIRSALMLVHRQLLCILTKGIEKTLYSRPNFDVRPLLGGTDGILRSLLSHYSSSLLSVLYAASSVPAAATSQSRKLTVSLSSPSASPQKGQTGSTENEEALEDAVLAEKGGFEPLPLNATMRHIANNMLKTYGTSHVLAGLILADHRVVAMSLAKNFVLQPTDIVLLVNFVVASPALRQAESWTPICLPGFNDRAFLYMYVRYLVPHVCYICLSSKNDGDQFFALSSHCTKTFALLTNTGCLTAIERSREYCPYSLPRSLWGSLALLHVGFFLPPSKQFFSSALSSEIDTGKHAIRDILKLYVQCDESLQGAKLPTHAYIETERHKAYVWRTAEFHLYTAVPAWIELTTVVLEQLAKWVMDQRPFLFITNIPVISG